MVQLDPTSYFTIVMKLPTDDDSNEFSLAMVPIGWIVIMIRLHTAGISETRIFPIIFVFLIKVIKHIVFNQGVEIHVHTRS